MTTAAGSHAVEARIMGGYVFVVMFPAVFGPLVAGRLAIGVWVLMFAALGASLVRADPGRSR